MHKVVRVGNNYISKEFYVIMGYLMVLVFEIKISVAPISMLVGKILSVILLDSIICLNSIV